MVDIPPLQGTVSLEEILAAVDKITILALVEELEGCLVCLGLLHKVKARHC